MGLWRDGEHVVGRVHLGLGLSGNDSHHVDLVPVVLLYSTRQDVVVTLSGPIEGKLVPEK